MSEDSRSAKPLRRAKIPSPQENFKLRRQIISPGRLALELQNLGSMPARGAAGRGEGPPEK